MHAQVRALRTLMETIAGLDRALGALLLEHPKAELLASLPRIGKVNLAQIVAEVKRRSTTLIYADRNRTSSFRRNLPLTDNANGSAHNFPEDPSEFDARPLPHLARNLAGHKPPHEAGELSCHGDDRNVVVAF